MGGISCGCGDCRTLNAFLRDQTRKVGRFQVAEKRRQCLQKQFAGIHVTHETERMGSPYILTVTKTGGAYTVTLKEWK